MTITCQYYNCHRTNKDISMFSFPVNDPERLKMWIRNSGNVILDSLTVEELRHRFICAAHFSASSIHEGKNRNRLLGPAVPEPFQQFNIEAGVSGTPPSPEILKVKTPKKFYFKKRKLPSVSPKNSSPMSLHSLFDRPIPIVSTPTSRLSKKIGRSLGKRTYSRKSLFQENQDDTPSKKTLRNTASKLLLENKALKAKIRRLQAKTKISKEVLLIKPSDFRSKVGKTFALMQLRKANDKKKWTKEEKNLCLSIFYKSSASYIFMRRQGVVLPSPTTIRKWLSESNCLPGLCPEIFKQLKHRFENATIKDKACVVCFDEMSIMENLEYSKKFDIIEGFEDLGKNRRTNCLAKYCLVFIVRGLYGAWKMPIAYFLSHSNVKSENLKLLLKAVINKLFDSGLLPKAVVCDQMSINQKIYKDLGVTSKYPFLFINGRKIFALFDAPHLIKNVRNNFLNNDFIIDNKVISFQDIIKTYNIDIASKKSRAMLKITQKHLAPNNFQKMNVRLATQIFSNTVASAIKTAVGTGDLKSESANDTANFVLATNNMFDGLNSKREKDTNAFKCALSQKSAFVKNAILEGQKVYRNLKKISIKKKKDNKIIKLSTRPPCFEGIVQTCEAVLQIFNEENTDPQISYLITNKLNQDVIENLFARFRQKCGSNRNPTAKLLRTIFRSTIINSFIKLPQDRNCEEDEEDFIDLEPAEDIVTGSSSKYTEQKNTPLPSTSKSIENVSNIPDKSKSELNVEVEGMNYSKSISFEECSVNYFAGYLAKCCIIKFDCEMCKNLMIQNNIDLEDEKQLLILNKSYSYLKSVKLKMPSDMFYQIINLALDSFNIYFENIKHQINIKCKLSKTIINYLKTESPELLDVFCKEHIEYVIDHMVLVKLHYFCKTHKRNVLKNKMNPKLKIIKNQ